MADRYENLRADLARLEACKIQLGEIDVYPAPMKGKFLRKWSRIAIFAMLLEDMDAARAERDRMREALRNMIAMAIPGMDWTDEIGEQCLADARAALAALEGGVNRD